MRTITVVPWATCLNCHTIRRGAYDFTDPLSPPPVIPLHAISAPAADRIMATSCHAHKLWPHSLSRPHELARHNPWWVKRNYLDAAMTQKTRHIPVMRTLKIDACLNLNRRRAWLGPWYAKFFAGLTIDLKSAARICMHLTGDRRGITPGEHPKPAATIEGVILDTWSETAVPKSVEIVDGRPLMLTRYTKSWYRFWRKRGTLIMNPLVKFRDHIPVYYRLEDRRRLTRTEYRSIHGTTAPNPLFIRHMPLLHDMVASARIPGVIPLATLLTFASAWSKTWSHRQKPQTMSDRMSRETMRIFSDNIRGISGTVRFSPEMIMLPGFYAAFKNEDPPELRYVLSKGWPYRPDDAYAVQVKVRSNGPDAMPLDLSTTARLLLDQLYIKGVVDFGKTSARLYSHIRVDRHGSFGVVAIPSLHAHLNPFRYGGSAHPDRRPAVETTGGTIHAGTARDGYPPGIGIVKNANGAITATTNLAARYDIRIGHSVYTATGDLLASIAASWAPARPFSLRAGANRIEISDFKLTRGANAAPLISRARLILTDMPRDLQDIAEAHPAFQPGRSGFAVRLEFNNLKGLGYRSGYLIGFIPAPREGDGSHYDPRRFALQDTLTLAFGLVAARASAGRIQGELSIKQVRDIIPATQPISTRGIVVEGDIIAVSGTRIRHLIKNGHAMILAHPDSAGGKRWYTLLRADHVGLKQARIIQPHITMDTTLHTENGADITMRMHRLAARFSRFSSGSIGTGRGRFTASFQAAFDRHEAVMRIFGLKGLFRVKRIAPAGLAAATRGRYTSFDIDGSIAGSWRHYTRAGRGRGFMFLRGDKEGDLHLRGRNGRRVGSARLGRETPLFSDTRWVMLRIDGMDRRGWLNGRFCLKTDIDLMALKPLGVRHADYIEWIMAHDNIALPKGIIARSEKYYTDLMRGKALPKGKRRRVDVCRRILKGL